jgi:hypothetical protein
MLKRYTFWLWLAVVFQLLTAIVHALSLFTSPDPSTLGPAERQLLDLMTNHRMDLGPWFHPTMGNLFTAVSACYSLLCLLGALTAIYLLRKKVDAAVVKGLTGIQLLVFAICFVVMLVFTFLPPIVLTGLITLSLALSFFTNPGSRVVQDA